MDLTTVRKPLSLPPSRPVEMVIGPYRPYFEIGSGGMASVYIARENGHSGLQRTVALKLMHEHLSRQDDFKKRFLDEAQVLTRIAHPYVCRVFGFGEEAGRPFMAMEYLVGEPLSRILRALKRRAQDVPARKRARLFARAIANLAEGLHAAHQTQDPHGVGLGVVHRDVTPQNLFLLYDGTVRVLDFGIARYRDRQVHTQTTGRLLGKLPYMAPEQVLSEPYDHRVDVWALGVVLWELVTLGRLFKRETEVRTMRAVCSERIPHVSEYESDLPPGLDEVLKGALERSPVLRYESARAFSQALELWLSRTGAPVTHGDLSDFLNGFFPGSQTERRRWAEESTPTSGVSLRAADLVPTDDDDPTRRELEFETAQAKAHAPASMPMPSIALRSASLPSPPPSERPSNRAVPNLSFEPLIHEPDEVSGAVLKQPSWTQWAPAPLFVGLVTVALITTTGESDRELATARATLGGVSFPVAAWRLEPASLALNATFTTPNVVDVSELPLETEPESTKPKTPRQHASTTPSGDQSASPGDRPVGHEAPLGAVSTGDLLVVSSVPGVRVFSGQRLLGITPVRARLQAGPITLHVEASENAPRVPMTTTIAPGRLNLLSVKLGQAAQSNQ